MEFGFCQDTKGKPSPDGTCAGETGYTCEGSAFGSCCSEYHFCGSESDHCAAEKCIPGFGDCESSHGGLNSTKPVAPTSTQAPGYSHPTHMPKPSFAASGFLSVMKRAEATSVTSLAPNPTTIIQPAINTSPANATASALASATASAAACANPLPKRSTTNAVFKREEIDPDCVPCEGQGGELPYCGADHT
jgi:hypothetical protein